MRKVCQAPSLESAVKLKAEEVDLTDFSQGPGDQSWPGKVEQAWKSWSGKRFLEQEAGLTWFDWWSGAYGG